MTVQTAKILSFSKGTEQYSIRYDQVRDLINTLVDYADDPTHPLDLMDVFILVHRLAYTHSRHVGKTTVPPNALHFTIA